MLRPGERHFNLWLMLVQSRKTGNRFDMNEKLLSGTYSNITNDRCDKHPLKTYFNSRNWASALNV